jgi:hypothetical protein
MTDAKGIVKQVSGFIRREEAEIPKLKDIKRAAEKLASKHHAKPMRHHKS